jgi:NADH:ubiquinone oxidoreductase subunit F (NADH-binding)
MKWFIYIFSFYILTLACMPCSDGAVADVQTTIRASIPVSHSDHEHQQDFCSPLCVCACCSVQSTPLKSTIFNFIDQLAKHTYAIAADHPLTSIADKIWQPPQLV